MSLTKNDLQQIRTIMHEEVREVVREVIQTEGREIIRDEINEVFETRGKEIIRDEVSTAFETQGKEIIREEMRITMNTEGRETTRSIVSAELQPVKESLARLEGTVEALENDIKDIYGMVSDLQAAVFPRGRGKKQTLEDKIRQAHSDVLLVAKQAGVSL